MARIFRNWAKRSEELKKSVNDQFLLEDRGMYASWIYPEYMGSPVANKTAFQDEIDKAWFDLATGLAGLRKIPNKQALINALKEASKNIRNYLRQCSCQKNFGILKTKCIYRCKIRIF